MLLNLNTGVETRPRAAASAANMPGNGRSPEIRTSAPSNRFACLRSAPLTRSAKNPTVPMLATASTIAAIRMVSSPARQSRVSMRQASRSVFISRRSRRRDAVVADEAAGGERKPARAATGERGVMRDEQQRRAVLVIEAEHEIDDFVRP